MSIEPAFDVTVATSADQEEEGSIDINLLYQRFQEKVGKNLIQGNRKNDLRPGQVARDD